MTKDLKKNVKWAIPLYKIQVEDFENNCQRALVFHDSPSPKSGWLTNLLSLSTLKTRVMTRSSSQWEQTWTLP